jgi:hypothetical protein
MQDIASVNNFLNVAETVPLFEYLEIKFLLEYDVFAPARGGGTRVHSHGISLVADALLV